MHTRIFVRVVVVPAHPLRVPLRECSEGCVIARIVSRPFRFVLNALYCKRTRTIPPGAVREDRVTDNGRKYSVYFLAGRQHSSLVGCWRAFASRTASRGDEPDCASVDGESSSDAMSEETRERSAAMPLPFGAAAGCTAGAAACA